MNDKKQKVNIIGAGLAGLSAAIELAKGGTASNLISLQPSERSQSVLAEGGINAALDTMGEGDRVEYHYADTMRGGVELADPNAVAGLTSGAPEVVRWLTALGVPFNMQGGELVLRNFGGQKRKRTAYARSSTGKIIMTALIDEARKYEAAGLIQRYPHHAFVRLLLEGNTCTGVRVRDEYTDTLLDLPGPVLLCSGGMNGVFPAHTTGTTQNSGQVAATVFTQGVHFGNLEMLQYHPTTIGIPGKRCLVTEAARGEGGRLYVEKNHDKWYFMEEKYPELKNLMPRDVVSREMYQVVRREDCGKQVYLDMTGLSEETWQKKLPDLREEILRYLALDPKTQPIPVEPGIHYFMGGIHTDEGHRTNLRGLYAAGEAACQYHGANRLGGNSMLGAIYGGRVAAASVVADGVSVGAAPALSAPPMEEDPFLEEASPVMIARLSEILLSGLGIVREEDELQRALQELKQFADSQQWNPQETQRIRLGEAMLRSALNRKESRGAHFRSDYPERDERLRKTTLAQWKDGEINISLLPLPERRS